MTAHRVTNRIIGTVIRELREDAGWSLYQAAAHSGGRLKPSVLGAYERGERTVTVDKLAEVAAVYEMDLRMLLAVLELRLTPVSERVESPA